VLTQLCLELRFLPRQRALHGPDGVLERPQRGHDVAAARRQLRREACIQRCDWRQSARRTHLDPARRVQYDALARCRPRHLAVGGANLYGLSGGVDFQLSKFGASLGVGYQFGTSPDRSSTGSLTILQTEISLQSISMFYAISYEF